MIGFVWGPRDELGGILWPWWIILCWWFLLLLLLPFVLIILLLRFVFRFVTYLIERRIQ